METAIVELTTAEQDEVLGLVAQAQGKWKSEEPPATGERLHTLVSEHGDFEIWECPVTQNSLNSTATYHFARGVVGLLRCLASGAISGTDVHSGHRVRRQRESAGVKDPQKALATAKSKLDRLTAVQKQELLAELQADLSADVGID